MKEIFKQLIVDFHKMQLPQPSCRVFTLPELPPSVRKANVFIGMRRSGKTWALYQQMQLLLKQNVKIEQMLYLNFEDERLPNITSNDLQKILDAYFELYPQYINQSKVYFFFDEIQEIPNWEKFIRRILDKEKMMIYITGSSAKMLSKEIASSLRGRTITREIFPFSFVEYLQYLNIDPKLKFPLSTEEQQKIKHHLQNFLQRGGFPEVVALCESPFKKIYEKIFNKLQYQYQDKPEDHKNIIIFNDIDKKITDIFAKLDWSKYPKFEDNNSMYILLNEISKFTDGMLDNQIRELLQDYVSSVVQRDIIDRHQLKNSVLVKNFSSLCLKNSAKLFSIHKHYKDLKSQGRKVSKKTLYDLMNYFEDAYCIFSVPAYSFSARKTANVEKKLYAIDQGLITAYTIKDEYEDSTRLETVVFSHLRRNHQEVYYYKTDSGKEVDFLIFNANGKPVLYQVAFSLSNAETLQREIAALEEAMVKFKLRTSIIVTLDDERKIQISSGEIQCVPIWKILLESTHNYPNNT